MPCWPLSPLQDIFRISIFRMLDNSNWCEVVEIRQADDRCNKFYFLSFLSRILILKIDFNFEKNSNLLFEGGLWRGRLLQQERLLLRGWQIWPVPPGGLGTADFSKRKDLIRLDLIWFTLFPLLTLSGSETLFYLTKSSSMVFFNLPFSSQSTSPSVWW